MIRSLYDWTMGLAGHKNALWALAAVSFVESSVFPVPPDVLLIPMVLAARRDAFRIAAVCTVASVAGGFLGYAIGYWLFESIGRQLLTAYGAMGSYEALRATFAQYGAWIIIVKGLTPIPYKLVTITAGAVHMDLLTFAVASLVSRSLRFVIEAALLWKFGEPVRIFIERRLKLVTTAFAVLLVGGFVALKVL